MSAVRAKRSKVWAHFIKMNESSARCNICQKVVASKGGNTSNIIKHLQSTHSIKLKECGVFDCLNKAAKVSSPANANSCNAVASSVQADSDTASSSSSHSSINEAAAITAGSLMQTTPFTIAKRRQMKMSAEKNKECHRAVTKFTVKDLQPFATVQSKWFR
ncbi:hypothetical protein ABVT39_004898 [Epinephelus coioides]